MVKKFKALLGLKIYELTGDEIGKIKKHENESNRFYKTILPEYCLHSNNGSIRTTLDYLQWIDRGDDKYCLFEANTLDDLLHEEISNSGLEYLLKDIDLRPYFNLLDKHNYHDLTRNNFFTAQYLVIDIIYTGGYWDNDFDRDIEVDSVITSNLNLIKP